MRKIFNNNPLLRPKNATFCPGCPKKDLNLNKEFVFDIPVPEQKKEEAVSKPKVSLLKDKIKNKINNQRQTLF